MMNKLSMDACGLFVLASAEQPNRTDVLIPKGATHKALFYEQVLYFRCRKVEHLNRVSEEWQEFVIYDRWNKDQWLPTEPGFCTRHLQTIQ
jgi:hypothetical protein